MINPRFAQICMNCVGLLYVVAWSSVYQCHAVWIFAWISSYDVGCMKLPCCCQNPRDFQIQKLFDMLHMFGCCLCCDWIYCFITMLLCNSVEIRFLMLMSMNMKWALFHLKPYCISRNLSFHVLVSLLHDVAWSSLTLLLCDAGRILCVDDEPWTWNAVTAV